MFNLLIATVIAPASVPDHRWPPAEDASSAASSASSKDCLEDVGILTVIEPKLKFRKVQRQIFLADVVVGADDAVLQQRSEALNRVCMQLAAHVFAFGVRDGFVRVCERVKVVIALILVSRNEIDVAADSLADETIQGLGVGVFDHLAVHVTLLRLIAPIPAVLPTAPRPAWSRLLACLFFSFPPRLGFINFNFAHQLWEILILHRGADALALEPRCPVIAAADLTMDLQSADSLLALTHQVDDFKPRRERIVSVLENRLGDDGEAIAVAPAAILVLTDPVESLGLESIDLETLAARTLHA